MGGVGLGVLIFGRISSVLDDSYAFDLAADLIDEYGR